MKQLWIILILALLPYPLTSAHADNVDGKAIICKEESEEAPYRGFEFVDDDGVVLSILWITTNPAEIRRYDGKSEMYVRHDYVDRIIWGNRYSLDRKTLELNLTSRYDEERVIPCKVYGSREDYVEAFEKYRKREQEKLDKKMEGNVI